MARRVFWQAVTAAVLVVWAVGGPQRTDAAGSDAAAEDAHAAAGGHSTEDPQAAAGGHAEHEAHGEAHGSPNPLVIGPDLAIVTAIVFLLLLTVLGKFAWRPILEALDRRERTIAEHLAAAESRQQEATRLLAQYEAKLGQATDEVRAMLDEARRDAEHTKSQIIAEARSAAQAEQERSIREVRLATDASLKQLSETSARLAVDLAGKILEQKLSTEEHDRLVRDALTRMPSPN